MSIEKYQFTLDKISSLEIKSESGPGCIPYLLNIGPYRPGFYTYLGWYTDDRDLKTLGWRGPWKRKDEAKNEVPEWWKMYGHDKPKVRFRLFEPVRDFHPGISDSSVKD